MMFAGVGMAMVGSISSTLFPASIPKCWTIELDLILLESSATRAVARVAALTHIPKTVPPLISVAICTGPKGQVHMPSGEPAQC
eukprot:SAG31_NODE_724_length_12555_cov_11.624277_10_plen_84_part_00